MPRDSLLPPLPGARTASARVRGKEKWEPCLLDSQGPPCSQEVQCAPACPKGEWGAEHESGWHSEVVRANARCQGQLRFTRLYTHWHTACGLCFNGSTMAVASPRA